MMSHEPSLVGTVNEEIPALIESLVKTEQRLEELTGGEVDTVAGRDGRTFMFRRAQDQLRHSEATKQADILDALSAHLALLDTQGNIISVNEAWRQFADANMLKTAEHSVGRNYLGICDQAQGDDSSEAFQVAAGIRAVLDGAAKSFSIEYPCHSPTEARWFLLTVTPLAGDRPNGVVVMHLNITERKLAAAALEDLSQKTDRRERMLTTLLGNLHDFAYIYDRAGRFLFANQPLLNLWGLTLDAVIGKNFYELGYPDDLAKRLQQELQEVFETGQSVTGETLYTSPTRVQGFYEYIFSPAFGTNGTVEFVVGSTRDITDRKLGEAALQASQKRLRDIIDGMGPAMFVGLLTTEGVLVEVNQSPLTAAGLKAEDVLGLPFAETPWWSHSPEAKHQLRDAITRAARGEASRYDVRTQGAGNQHIDIDFSLQPLRNEAGEVVGLVPSANVITERKQTEDALRLSEERLRAALAASRTGTFRWEFSTDELSWDDSLDALFGIPQGQAVRSLETFIATVHPEDRAHVSKACERCAREGADFDAEFRVVWPDGSLHWLDDKGKTFFDVAGRPLYMTGACVDITDRKLAETALRESEAEFRSLAEAMPQMVWITRPDGWNLYFSQQWTDYTGQTLEEGLGHEWNKPFHPDDQQRSWDAWQLATATIGIYSIEARIRRADGIYRWWLIRGVPQLDASGNVIKWFGTCTDIHDLKLAELEISRANEALRDSDEKFRALSDNITDVFWITSPDFKTMHYVSAGYELIWGRSAESLYANPHQWVESILPDERESAFAVFATLMGTAAEVNLEYRIARPDGTVRWIHDRGFQVRDALGKLVRLTGIATDITERKKMEAQLSQAQKLQAIGTLAGGIAHDFNNILAAIIGYSEMAKRGISRDSRAQAHLQQVLIASTRAKDLVKQILTFSRIEEPDRETLQLQPIIAETLGLLRVSLPSTVEIRQDIDPDAPSVMGDASQLHQLILNLCVNAAQAMKKHGGILGVRLTSLDIDGDFAGIHPELKEGPHVRLDVSDTGCGMNRASQERIFEPFFTTKAPGEGTGLGLAVVHGVIKNHGGAIVISSELGAGTTFMVYLPVCDRRPSPTLQELDSVPRGSGERILFVDDEVALVSLGQSMLEDLGYRVTTKTDSVEALAAFTSQPEDFDLVITDVTMPRLNGAELATALLEIRPTLPIILVSGYSAGLSQEKARAMGIRELIAKPCGIQVLGDAIRRSLVETKEE